MKPLRVEMKPFLKQISWLGIGFSLLLFTVLWAIGVKIAPLFLPFCGLGIFLLLLIGPVEMDSEAIRQTTALGRWQMRWDEITKIEIAPNSDMVFHGQNKRLAIPGSNAWANDGKDRMIEFFKMQVEQRKILVEQTKRAAFQMSKNTRTKGT